MRMEAAVVNDSDFLPTRYHSFHGVIPRSNSRYVK
jgi:hypothetical protein